MFNYIIKTALQNRLFVLIVSILLLVYGGYSITQLPIDVFPDLNRPTVTILTEAPGLAPEEVETLVTIPLETALNGAPDVQRVRSSSGIGLSIVVIEFDWNTKIYQARQLVQERLQLAQEKLPTDITPVIAPISSIMGEIMLIGVYSENSSIAPVELRSIADWTIRPRLLAIPGVAQVVAIGGGVKQYQVLVDPAKLANYNVTLEDVVIASKNAQNSTAGGYLFNQNQEALIRNIGRSAELEDLANSIIVNRDSTSISLKEVAEVKIGKKIMRGDAGINSQPAVILSVQKQPGADTVELTQQVEFVLQQLSTQLPKNVNIKPIFKQSEFISSAIANVTHALRDGAIIVTIILVLFLLNARTTFITLTAIPISIIIAAIVLKIFGLSINTMTLGGLAIAVGEMVDDAIIDVENVFRRLRENRALSQPRSSLLVVYEASLEIRNSIVYATVIVVLVFIPLFALSGIEGRLFAPIGIAYITAIAASLFTAITITPILCSLMLPNMKIMQHQQESWLVKKLKQFDRDYLLKYALNYPNHVIAIAIFMIISSFCLYPLMGKEFLPEFNEGTATINVFSAPGTTLDESNRIGMIAERLLLTIPEIHTTGRRTGRAEQDEHAEGLHYTEIDVDLSRTKRSRAAILEDIRTKLSEIPGVVASVGQPISHRLDHMLSGVRAQIAVKIFGQDLSVLRQLAAQVELIMQKIPGVVDLQTEKQVLMPQVRIEAKRDIAKLYGMQVGKLNEILEVALNGKVVAQVLDGLKSYDVLVQYHPDARNNVENLKQMLVDIGDNKKVPLNLLADVFESKGPNTINRENVQRRIVVHANVANSDLGSVVNKIESTLNTDLQINDGYHISLEGQFQSQQNATRLIALLSLVTLVLMFLILYKHFHSTTIVAQILLNIPLAFIGGLVLTYLLIGKISIASLVGFITLSGIASRNTIMMISHYLHLIEHEGEKFDKAMIIRGSLERLIPVSMTALTTGLALIPLVLAAGEPGKEILYPVAVVIMGGLISSTLLDMIVTPAVFYKFGERAVNRFLCRHNNELYNL